MRLYFFVFNNIVGDDVGLRVNNSEVTEPYTETLVIELTTLVWNVVVLKLDTTLV